MSSSGRWSLRDVRAWYEDNRERTLLGLLPEALADALLAETSVLELAPGQPVPAPREDLDILIVLEGKVSLRQIGGARAEIGVVAAGRSLNLAEFFGDGARAPLERVAVGTTTLLRLPSAHARRVFDSVPGLSAYLERMSLCPELHKLKNDLKMFGLEQDQVIRLVAGLTLESRPSLVTDAPQLIVVRSGDVVVFAGDGANRQQLGHYLVGDFFWLGSHLGEVQLDPGNGCEMWTVGQGPLEAILGPESASRLRTILEVLDGPTAFPGGDGAEARAGATELVAEDGEDDGLSVKDFHASGASLRWGRLKKYRVVRQHDEMDCGAACLAAAARYFGKRITVPVFRSLVHVTREGASMLALKRACQQVGIDAMGVFASLKGLQKMRMPLIALMNYHFVLVYEIGDRKVTYADPARGLVTEPRESFEKEWSKNALLLKPTKRLAAYPASQSTFRKYAGLFRSHRMALLEVLAASILVTIFGLLTPVFTQLIFDHVLAKGSSGLLLGLFLGVLGISVIASGVTWVRDFTMSHLTASLDAKFSALFLRHAFRLPLSFFAVRNVGDITTRIQEIEKIRNFFTGESIAIVISLMSTALYVAVLGMYSLWFLAVVGVLVPLMVLSLLAILPRLLGTLRDTYKASARNQSITFEQFQSLATIKALGGEVPSRFRWSQSFGDALRLRRRLERLGATTAGVSELFSGIARVSVLLCAVYLYLQRDLSLGQVVAVNLLIGKVIDPVIKLLMSWNQFNEAAVSLARVDDIFTSAPESSPVSQDHEHHEVRGVIDIENVSFRYGSELSPTILRNVSLSVHAGETVALVGPSGSGKSTLAYMINLLYTPTSGRILVDGIDSRDIPLSTLRSQISLIIQDSQLFSGSILDNIVLGDPQPSFQRAVSAAMAADAHDFIASMPEGYGTELGEGGTKLSGGQKQRLNIARALYRDPAVLILDEATASLDAVSERVVVENIKSRAKQRTTIIIAHRLNTVRYADTIVFIDGGSVVEKGSHDQLLARNGRYAELYRQQLQAG